MNKIENKHMNVKTTISCYIYVHMNVICFAKIDQIARINFKIGNYFIVQIVVYVPLKEVPEHLVMSTL